MWVSRINIHEHEGGVALNSHEDVIEVVGYATCQSPKGLHLLGMLELCLKLGFFFLRPLSFSQLLLERIIEPCVLYGNGRRVAQACEQLEVILSEAFNQAKGVYIDDAPNLVFILEGYAHD